MIARFKRWWQALTQRQRFEADLTDELAFHIESRRDHLIAQGVSYDQAMRQARMELGMSELHRDECRRARGLAIIDIVRADLRYALRSLRRNPGYSVTAVLVLAAAIAANSLLFGLYNAYALHGPPVQDGARWVDIESLNARGQMVTRWTAADAETLRLSTPAALDGVYIMKVQRLPVRTGADHELRMLFGEVVSEEYFALLKPPLTLGPGLHSSNHADSEPGVVISHQIWQHDFDASPRVLEQSLWIGQRAFRVMGVAAPDFVGTTVLAASFWILDRDYRNLYPEDVLEGTRFEVGGLLRPGAHPEQAAAALSPRILAGNSARASDQQIQSVNVTRRSGYLRAADREELSLVAIPAVLAFGLVLLVAAANLANLVLARFASRQQELAIRVSIGAGRARLIAQLLTECLLLALVAAIVGFLLAALLIGPTHRGILVLLSDFGIELLPVHLDFGVFAYGLALALLSALSFGLLPALLSTRGWRDGGNVSQSQIMQRGSISRLRTWLMSMQVAAGVVLLVLAALIAANAQRAQDQALGFDPTRVVSVDVNRLDREVAAKMAALPEVEQVATVSQTPMMGGPERVAAKADGNAHTLAMRWVDSGYFPTMGIALSEGRNFHRADESNAAFAIISKRTASTLWPGGSALGKFLHLQREEVDSPMPSKVEIIGIADDVASGWLIDGTDSSALYLPARADQAVMGSLLVRTRDAQLSTLNALNNACLDIAPGSSCQTLPLSFAVRFQHMPLVITARIAAALGWTAMLISCLGIYGLANYLVVQRHREIGVRLALGATHGKVMRHLICLSARQILLGIGIGLPIVFALSRILASYTDRIQTFDLEAFALTPLLLAAIALTAAWLPARRALRIPPSTALQID